jgi:hypothetical protein
VKETMTTTAVSNTGSVESLFAEARAKLAKGLLTEADIRALEAAALYAGKSGATVRQRLMYLHAVTPSIYSGLCAAVLHEPVKGHYATMDPLQKDPEYKSVHDALQDGWRIIHFPLQRAGFDDREIDVLGYEFVLEKLEHFNVI